MKADFEPDEEFDFGDYGEDKEFFRDEKNKEATQRWLRVREKYEIDHLCLTSDFEFASKLEGYIMNKAKSQVVRKKFNVNAEFEKHLSGCDYCKCFIGETKNYLELVIRD